jgi:UDP-glucose 4-epimerase
MPNSAAPNSVPRVIVTGGAGFVGSHLVERLLGDGCAVNVIDDCSTGSLENLAAVRTHPRLRVQVARVSEADLASLLPGAQAVFHLAAAVGVELVVRAPIRTLETNLHETEVLLRAAAQHGTPVLLTSTSEVYGKSAQASFHEEDDLIIGPPTHARWGYACSKLMDEFMALAYAHERQLPVVIARLFNTVGPRQTGRYGMVLPRFIAAARDGLPLKVFGDGRQTRCFCFVTDTVEALVRLQRHPEARGGVFNVGTTEEVSIRELAERVIRLLGSTSPIKTVPYSEAYAPGFEDMRRRRPCVEKLAGLTGFQPAIPLDETILRTAGG